MIGYYDDYLGELNIFFLLFEVIGMINFEMFGK